MDRSQEKRVLRKKEIMLFAASLFIYMIVYILLYLCLALLNAVITDLPPYIMLAGMIVLLKLAAVCTRRILKMPMVRTWFQ